MKKTTLLLVFFVLLLLNACSLIIDPTRYSSPDPRLAGTWVGEDNTPLIDNGYEYHYIKETYTFYEHSKIERERYRSYSYSSPGVNGGGTEKITWEYQWRNIGGAFFYRAYNHTKDWLTFDIDLSNIDSGKISIDGFELTKQ